MGKQRHVRAHSIWGIRALFDLHLPGWLASFLSWWMCCSADLIRMMEEILLRVPKPWKLCFPYMASWCHFFFSSRAMFLNSYWSTAGISFRGWVHCIRAGAFLNGWDKLAVHRPSGEAAWIDHCPVFCVHVMQIVLWSLLENITESQNF